MKYLLIGMLLISSCGYSSLDNESIGQVKRIHKYSPILCDPWTEVDISLGVMRNGVGSMSNEDYDLTIMNDEQAKLLAQANSSGSLVKIKYDIKRWNWCINSNHIKSVEILK